jgi:hypothetical protein
VSKKSSPNPKRHEDLSLYFLLQFYVLFRTLIHFKLIFVHDVRHGYNAIFLYVDIQFSHHLFSIDLVCALVKTILI